MKTILVLLLTCVMSFAQRSPEWLEENKKCWEYLRQNYPGFFATKADYKATIKIVTDYDRAARDGKWELFDNPWKPLAYIEDYLKVQAAQRAAQAAAAQEYESSGQRAIDEQRAANDRLRRQMAADNERLRQEMERQRAQQEEMENELKDMRYKKGRYHPSVNTP